MKITQLFRNSSIRWKLTIIFASSAILILLFAGYFIYSFSASFRKREFKLRLESRLHEVQRIMRLNPTGPLPEFSRYDESVLPREQLAMIPLQDTIKLINAEGKLLITQQEVPLNEKIEYKTIGSRDVAFLFDGQLDKLFIVSAIDVYGYTKMGNLKKVILTCLAISVLLLAFVSWFWTRRMLSPISMKIKKARQIGTDSLDLRLEVKNPSDELGLLAQTFNEMLDRLERGFKAQQQFIGNASHELRTPLTVLRTEADWALDRNRTLEEYQEVLRKVQDKSRQLSLLVDRLLILARIDGPQKPINLKPFPLDELLLQVVEQTQAENTNISLSCEISSSSYNTYFFRGDLGMIQTALNNLLDNAVKYGLNQPIEVSLNLNQDYYIIEVRDRGIGIAPEDVAHLFEAFYRSPKARKTASGTGLGLALVYAIASWHHGRLEAKTDNGVTSFRLYLPLSARF